MAQAFSVNEHIDRPPEEVWAALTDWSTAHEWMPGIDSIRSDGPLAVGTMLTFLTRGRDHGSEVVALEPGAGFTLRSVQAGFTADYHYEVTAEAAGTRLSLTAGCTSSGVRSLFGPLLRWVLKRSDSPQIANLKARLES